MMSDSMRDESYIILLVFMCSGLGGDERIGV